MPPVVLDDVKKIIGKEIKEFKARAKPLKSVDTSCLKYRRTLNAKEQGYTQVAERIAQEGESELGNIADITAAIVLTHLAHESDRQSVLCEKNAGHVLLGDEMLPYTFSANAVEVHE